MNWPWSWPFDVPAVIRDERGEVMHFERRGVVSGGISPACQGYAGTITINPSWESPMGPLELDMVVSRRYMRQKLRDGDWELLHP